MAIRIFNRPAVWVRKDWEDAWELVPKLSAIGITAVAAPGIGSASFYFDYGFVSDHGVPSFYVAPPFAYVGWYVQVRATIDAVETELWTGLFVVDGLSIDGTLDNGVGTGQQRYEAVELSLLLDREVIRNAVAIQNGVEVNIDRVPMMNRSTDRGLSETGNRSSLANNDGIYRYSADGAVWTHKQYLEMILWDNQPDGIRFALTGQHSMLDFIASSGRVEGLTLLGLLDSLVDRKRGFVWKLDDVGFGRGPVVAIKIATVFDEEITVGSVTLSPNPDIVELTLSNANENEEIRLSLVDTNRFDKVRARGGRVKSCFTIDKNVFVKAWTAAEEGYYKDGAKNEDGYDELDEDEKKVENDRYRSQERFRQVYRQWVIPRDWNWNIDYVDSDPDEKYHVNPAVDEDGGLIEGAQGDYFNDGRHLLRKLPLKRGWGYTGSEAVDRNPPDIVSEYSSPMVWVKIGLGYYPVSKLSWYEIDDEGNKASSVGVKMLDRTMGFELSSPGHQFGLGHFAGAEPAGLPAVFDWEGLIATVAVETDQRIEVVVEGEAIAGGGGRELVIDLPYAQLWWIAPHTVVGIDAAGKKEEYGGSSNILRDDSLLLEAVAAAALGWYGKGRQTLNITVVYLTDDAKVGDLIRSVTLPNIYEEVNTVVTQVVHDFIAGTTTVVTNFSQLDFAAIPMGHSPDLGSSGSGSMGGSVGRSGGGSAATVGGGGAGMNVTGAGSLEREVIELKEELGDLQVEPPAGGGGGSNAGRARRAKAQEGGQADGKVSFKLLDKEDEETGDAFDAYAFEDKSSTNMADYLPVIAADDIKFVKKGIGGDWFIDWTPNQVTAITVQTNYQVDGGNKKLQKKTRASVKVFGSDVESGWTDVHTGTECP